MPCALMRARAPCARAFGPRSAPPQYNIYDPAGDAASERRQSHGGRRATLSAARARPCFLCPVQVSLSCAPRQATSGLPSLLLLSLWRWRTHAAHDPNRTPPRSLPLPRPQATPVLTRRRPSCCPPALPLCPAPDEPPSTPPPKSSSLAPIRQHRVCLLCRNRPHGGGGHAARAAKGRGLHEKERAARVSAWFFWAPRV